MSLEDAINRLASAAERNYSGSAVAEIIRNRDEANRRVVELERQLNHVRALRDASENRADRLSRSNQSLRGVITRMKKARQS